MIFGRKSRRELLVEINELKKANQEKERELSELRLELMMRQAVIDSCYCHCKDQPNVNEE